MTSRNEAGGARASSRTKAVRCTRLVHDIDQNTYGLELRFACADGSRGVLTIPGRDRAKPHEVYLKLLDHGANLPSDPKVARALVAKVLRTTPTKVRRVTKRGGWHGRAFVGATWTVGGDASAPRLVIESSSRTSIYARSGGIRAWRNGLRRPCRASSYLAAGIGIGFAAPTMELIGEEEGAAFNLFGASSTGKSLVARACQSVFARARKNDLATHDLSDPGRDDLCFERNDGVVILDEEGRLKGSPAQQRAHLKAFAYAIAGGVGRKRANLAQSSLPDLTWVCLGLTTAEVPLEDDDARQRNGGERLRHIDIPVPKLEQGGIFDRLSGERVGKRAATAARQVERTIAANFGLALRQYVRWLAADPEGAERRAREIVDGFVAERGAVGDPWEARFARKFGIVLAGMILASEAGVAPWREKQARRAVARVYRAARGAIVTVGENADEVVGLLRGGLSEGRFPDDAKVLGLPTFAPEGAWGVCRRHKRLGDVVAVDPAQFARLAGSEARATVVLDRLLTAGTAVRNPDGKRRFQLHHGKVRRRWVLLRRPALD